MKLKGDAFLKYIAVWILTGGLVERMMIFLNEIAEIHAFEAGVWEWHKSGHKIFNQMFGDENEQGARPLLEIDDRYRMPLDTINALVERFAQETELTPFINVDMLADLTQQLLAMAMTTKMPD